VALVLSGCISLAPNYERPPIELPAEWTAADGKSAADIGVQWWKIFGDAQLERLIDDALANNANLQLAVARVDEARALAGFARAERYPIVSAELERERTSASLRTSTSPPAGTPRESDNYRGVVNVSYELDLWARLRDSSAAARAELLATEAAQETVRIALAADVAQAYFALRALDEQLAATQRSVITRSESLTLQKLRYEVGVISEFEYRQLEAEVLAAQAQLPLFERLRAQQESALAVLLGRSPRAIYEDKTIELAADEASDPPALVVPAGLPSQLLLRRPDLTEAEQRLIAANARIGIARAAYFPSISLTGYFGSQSSLLSDLFIGPAGTWNAAARLTQPIWGAGRVGDQVDAASARQRQALAQYRQAIQNAFRDVRDAVIAQTKTRAQFDAEHRRVGAMRETLRLAKLRYNNGVASQLDVLDAERGLLAAQLNRSDALRAQRAAIANLFKALGGGWRPEH
jgi:multidrug efflux system outer membrane protein